MPPFDTLELRAIHIDYPAGVKRLRLTCRNVQESYHETFEIPATTIMNPGQIRQAVKTFYNDDSLTLDIPYFLMRLLTGP